MYQLQKCLQQTFSKNCVSKYQLRSIPQNISNGGIRFRLAVAALVNRVYIKVQSNMAAESRQINMGIFFTNRKLPPIHSESVPRLWSKAIAYSYAKNMCSCLFGGHMLPDSLAHL